jgi:hypothetical protein
VERTNFPSEVVEMALAHAVGGTRWKRPREARLPLKDVEETRDGGVRIGALVPNSDLAYHPLVAQRYPLE